MRYLHGGHGWPFFSARGRPAAIGPCCDHQQRSGTGPSANHRPDGQAARNAVARRTGQKCPPAQLEKAAGALRPAFFVGGAAPASVSDAEVIHALEAGQFLVYYQPKFTLQDLQVDSLELLARWNHPRLGLLSPSRFLPTLERLGLLDRLLHQQIDQCLHFRQQAKTYGFDFKFSINIQTFQLASEGLFDAVSTRLRAFDTPGTCLCFEMTETDAQTLTPMNLENLVRLRMLGCVLSIDDFGAGHSSLQRLCTLPFNEIKLDGLFVRELNATSRSGVAITSTLQIADALGIDVVIEGIETQEQRTQLINLGCRLGQGYYFAMPMPATKLLVWLFNKVFQDYLSTVRRRLLSLPPP
ncbi:hypothetical protein CWC48_14195 [Pseudomonas sp. S10E 269]|nr:hypothetical protein CWC48_14195 [Pseudomonas sp. S10E 269]